MSERYEAGSPEWLAALHGIVAALRPGAEVTRDFSQCEVYTNVPPHIPSDGGRIAFTMTLRAGSNEVSFERREAEHPDFKLTIDYAHVVPAARFVIGGDPARQAEMEGIIMQAIADGHASIVGEPPTNALDGVHDLIADMTA